MECDYRKHHQQSIRKITLILIPEISDCRLGAIDSPVNTHIYTVIISVFPATSRRSRSATGCKHLLKYGLTMAHRIRMMYSSKYFYMTHPEVRYCPSGRGAKVSGQPEGLMSQLTTKASGYACVALTSYARHVISDCQG